MPIASLELVNVQFTVGHFSVSFRRKKAREKLFRGIYTLPPAEFERPSSSSAS
jgi:hypothetical protein